MANQKSSLIRALFDNIDNLNPQDLKIIELLGKKGYNQNIPNTITKEEVEILLNWSEYAKNTYYPEHDLDGNEKQLEYKLIQLL